MGRPRLSAKQEDAIRKRLQVFVDELYGGDWAELAARIGVERTTWYPWTGQGAKKGLPQAATLTKMAEGCRLSIDWLLTGRGPKQWRKAIEADPLPDQLRCALVSEYAASEPALVSILETGERRDLGRPTLDEVERAVPPAGTVYRLSVEFMRPLVRRSLWPLREAALFADGIERDPDALRTLGEKKAAALAKKKQGRAEEEVARHHFGAEGLAAYAAEQHRNDRPAYQWVAERVGIQPLPL